MTGVEPVPEHLRSVKPRLVVADVAGAEIVHPLADQFYLERVVRLRS